MDQRAKLSVRVLFHRLLNSRLLDPWFPVLGASGVRASSAMVSVILQYYDVTIH